MRGERGMSDVVETTSDEDGGAQGLEGRMEGARARGADGGAQRGGARARGAKGGSAGRERGCEGCKGARGGG